MRVGARAHACSSMVLRKRNDRSWHEEAKSQQTRVYPYPLGAGSARPNPKMGAPDPENPLFLGFSVLRGEGARPRGRGRSGDSQKGDEGRGRHEREEGKKGKARCDCDLRFWAALGMRLSVSKMLFCVPSLADRTLSASLDLGSGSLGNCAIKHPQLTIATEKLSLEKQKCRKRLLSRKSAQLDLILAELRCFGS